MMREFSMALYARGGVDKSPPLNSHVDDTSQEPDLASPPLGAMCAEMAAGGAFKSFALGPRGPARLGFRGWGPGTRQRGSRGVGSESGVGGVSASLTQARARARGSR